MSLSHFLLFRFSYCECDFTIILIGNANDECDVIDKPYELELFVQL